MLLHDLIARLEPEDVADSRPLRQRRACAHKARVRSVEEDSRRIGPGDVFLARKGQGTDGKQFAAAAVAAGAVAIVSDGAIDPPLDVPVFVVRDAVRAAGILAHAAAGDPARHMKTIGVTGTNGKTTTTFLLRQILNSVGIRCGLVGTCEIDDGRAVRSADMTTPGACELAEIFAAMKRNGCGAVAMETSSHALAQGRVAGVHFAAAGFTNLTGDHLDFHKTMAQYAAAKAKLFEMLDSSAVAVVNAEDQWSGVMVERCKGRVVWFGEERAPRGSSVESAIAAAAWRDRGAGYCASDVHVTAQASSFLLRTPRGEADVRIRLIGRHNIQNALCAAALACETFGLSVEQVAAALAEAVGAPGRLQRVDAGQPFSVLVDYAHTDDALANVLAALRPITRGKLRVVFGCGGDRDRTKRPRMAAVAEKWADVLYVTSDNPRTEDPHAILEEIVTGLSSPPALVEVDRRIAIRRAIEDAGEDDVVLIAGKGHENYQIIGKTKNHFDDVEEARQAIAALQIA